MTAISCRPVQESAVTHHPNSPSPVDELIAAFGGDVKHFARLSPELLEILLAFGPPPRPPEFRGDAAAYAAAVNHFIKLSATPDAKARMEAVQRYFDARRGTRESDDAENGLDS